MSSSVARSRCCLCFSGKHLPLPLKLLALAQKPSEKSREYGSQWEADCPKLPAPDQFSVKGARPIRKPPEFFFKCLIVKFCRLEGRKTLSHEECEV